LNKFLKLLANSKIGLFLRERTGIRPPVFLFGNQSSFLSSDLFFWRTDNGFSTIFRASDILKKYYDSKSELTLIFYDSKGDFLLQETFEFKHGLAVIKITADLLGMEGMGTFAALNTPTEPLKFDVQVTNRCYVGYGKNASFSMMHGNLTAIKVQSNVKSADFIKHIKPAISSRKGNYTYHIQKPNYSNVKISLIFINPLDRKIEVAVNKKRYQASKFSVIIISIPHEDDCIVVKSDFIWPRPIVFCEKENFIDVHHG